MTAWGRSCSVLSGGSAGRLVPRPRPGRLVAVASLAFGKTCLGSAQYFPLCVFFTRAQVLEVLWELAHLPTLPTSLVQQALEEHLGILSDAYAVKEAVKRNYIIKCIEDIKKVRRLTPTPRQGFVAALRGETSCIFRLLTVLLDSTSRSISASSLGLLASH